MRIIGWRVTVKCGFHGHKVMATLLGLSYVGRLSSGEKIMVNQLIKNMVKPGQILLTNKDQDQTNINTIKTIYNEQKGLRTEIKHLMKLIERDKYVY